MWDPKYHTTRLTRHKNGEFMDTLDPIVEAREPEPPTQPPRWETAECTCPDWCERDHELD
jgi:hypothetical protein